MPASVFARAQQGAFAPRRAAPFGSVAQPATVAQAAPVSAPAAQGDPMQAFLAMLPALFQNQSAFANPAASQFLSSLFPGFGGPAPQQPLGPVPGAGFSPGFGGDVISMPVPNFNARLGAGAPQQPFMPIPFEGTGIPGRQGSNKGFNPWNTVNQPGPAPDPFTALRGLAGPFGNGGGAIAPFGNAGGFRRSANFF